MKYISRPLDFDLFAENRDVIIRRCRRCFETFSRKYNKHPDILGIGSWCDLNPGGDVCLYAVVLTKELPPDLPSVFGGIPVRPGFLIEEDDMGEPLTATLQ